jgi:ADP-dependent NAD(P)H-hydrate dehydratase
MSSRIERVTPELLHAWGLPRPGDSKYGRGEVNVIGGSMSSPGAVILAGMAALRVGAGRLTLAVDGEVAASVAVAMPESAVIHLDSLDAAADADATLFGPGLDDATLTAELLRALAASVTDQIIVLDAFALGVLADVDVSGWRGRLVLTPNKVEAALLLGIDEDSLDLETDIARIALKYGAVVSCYGIVSDGERVLRIDEGGAGLGTSGSGDVLAGAITGLAARGASPLQAAVIGTWAHAAAGDRLEHRIAPVGFLARELVDELPGVLSTL